MNEFVSDPIGIIEPIILGRRRITEATISMVYVSRRYDTYIYVYIGKHVPRKSWENRPGLRLPGSC